jgi:hypothetical protein
MADYMFSQFLGRLVTVKVWGQIIVKGVLVAHQQSNVNGHLPDLLILKSDDGLLLLREWGVITVG